MNKLQIQKHIEEFVDNLTYADVYIIDEISSKPDVCIKLDYIKNSTLYLELSKYVQNAEIRSHYSIVFRKLEFLSAQKIENFHYKLNFDINENFPYSENSFIHNKFLLLLDEYKVNNNWNCL